MDCRDAIQGLDAAGDPKGQFVWAPWGVSSVTLTVCANLLQGKEPEPIAEALRDMPEDPPRLTTCPHTPVRMEHLPTRTPGRQGGKPTPE
jgi:hypothetical protein